MKTYNELKSKLSEIGFKDVEANYSSGAAVLLHFGYGRNNNPWPQHQIRVFRTQEGGLASPIYFQDWIEVTGQPTARINGLEQIWAAAMKLADVALTPRKAA